MFSQKTGAAWRNERSAFCEGSSLRSMDHIAVSLAPGRLTFRRAHVQHASCSTRDQVVNLGEKHFEKRGRVRPVIADHQIDHRCFALQWAADDRWRKKISGINGQQG